MVAAALQVVPYFEPQEPRDEQVNVRITASMKRELEDLARLWTHLSKVQTGNPKAKVTAPDAVFRLIRAGLDGAWAEVGGRPSTDSEWRQVEKRAAEIFSKK